jgi:hypothetical protein
VCEGQMQELQDLEEGAESVHKPVLILFRDSSLQGTLDNEIMLTPRFT